MMLSVKVLGLCYRTRAIGAMARYGVLWRAIDGLSVCRPRPMASFRCPGEGAR